MQLVLQQSFRCSCENRVLLLQLYENASVIDDLTHWAEWRICLSDLTSIGSDNGSSPGRCQAIIGTNAGMLLTGPLGTNVIAILIKIVIFPFRKMRLKVSSAKRRPFCLGINVLTWLILLTPRLSCHLNLSTNVTYIKGTWQLIKCTKMSTMVGEKTSYRNWNSRNYFCFIITAWNIKNRKSVLDSIREYSKIKMK